MNIKTIFSILLLALSGYFFYSFVLVFKETAVDNVSEQLVKLESAYTQATEQVQLKALQTKKQILMEREINFLQNFIPQNLHSGRFVYNLGQMANQNRMTIKNLQYSIVDDSSTNPSGEKKLVVEFTLDGRYEDFTNWLGKVERSEVLMDIQNLRASKSGNNSEVISFYVKLHAYGLKID